MTPSSAPGAPDAAAQTAADATAAQPGGGPAATSPEARAWNAAATAQEIAPADKTDTSALPPPPVATGGTIEDMVDRVMPAVVLVETTTGRGSGFFVAHDTLLTNVHVVQNDGYVTLRRMDGSTASARVAAKAPAYDIAVLKVAQPSPSQAVIAMATSRVLKPGQEIVVIGSALGTLQNSVSRGIVSGLRTAGGASVVQTDAAINPGNSGGPMLDRDGAAIAITTMSYRNTEGLNFGVAIDHARELLEGRLANLGSSTGLNEIQSSPSRPAESDRRQQQGEEQFRSRIGELADAADSIDAGWQRFRGQCYQSPIRGTFTREWFALLTPGALPGNAGEGCLSYYAAMDRDIKQYRDIMRRALADARRANVLPGTVRDELRARRLEFEWER